MSGNATFLFTDIEGSTRLWERYPAAMKTALARHDALLRETIAHHRGVVFKTVGDAFCAVFDAAADALLAAHAAQRLLAEEAWPPPVVIKVRMALHTAEVERRDDDYFGPPLNRVARLMAAGHGGQILLSLATEQQVRDRLPQGLALRDMGERRLKDLIRPERVFQLIGGGLGEDFAPLRTLDVRTHNLPIQTTSFVGREREMRELKSLLGSSRLVTLTGAGGAGKTRLALQVAAECIDDYADGARLAELAPIGDGRLVPQAVATVLGVKEQAGTPLADTIARDLADKELLLIVDNCEHVIGASAQLCQTLLAACPRVAVLATSREALRIAGESTFRVPPLDTPDPKTSASIADLQRSAAVELFVDRARSVRQGLMLDERSVRAIARIAGQLDGMPLAIELAAARVGALSVDEIDRRLDQRFRLLTSGARTALPRQRTLRAAIDWSYELLEHAEQRLLSRLSVFANGWALDAAERICADDDVPASDVLDLLVSLADKSLVLAEERTGATRYRLLETVRQYSAERLQDSGDSHRLRGRHLAHFVALGEQAESHANTAEQQTWLDGLEVEHDNLRAALAWSSAQRDQAAIGLRLAGALWWFWHVRGYPSEGREFLATLLAAAPEDRDPGARAKALNSAGMLAWQQGDYAAGRALLEQCLAMQRRLGDQRGLARALSNLGILARDQGDYDASAALQQESVAIRRDLGDKWGTAAALCNLGLVELDRAQFGSARALFEEAASIFRDVGDQRGVAGCLCNLGEVAILQRDFASGKHYSQQALDIFRAVGDRRGISITLTGLGQMVAQLGNYGEARALQAEALSVKVELGDQRGIAISLEALAYVQSACGEHEQAARLLGRAEAMREDLETPLALSEREEHDGHVAAAREALGDAAFDHAWQAGRATSTEEIIERVVR